MHIVGHHLQLQAVAVGAGEKDAYARSAFNRYYYSAFLTVREMLRKLDPAWSSPDHAGIPGLLRGQVQRKLKAGKPPAQKIGDTALVSKIERAVRSIHELAEILNTARGIRVVADYEAEEPVVFDGIPRFTLRSVDITDAHDWAGAARLHCATIQSAWEEIYG